MEYSLSILTAKIIIPTLTSIIIGFIITPFVSDFLYKHKLWKKKSVQKTLDGKEALISKQLHNDENKFIPRMGGVIVWLTVLLSALFFWVISHSFEGIILSKLDFISRKQTWIPLFVLLFGALIGLVDDLSVTSNHVGSYVGGGISLKVRLLFVSIIALFCGVWFYLKLDPTYSTLSIPFIGEYFIGIAIIPLFIIVMNAMFASGVIDGIDGLSGGVFSSAFFGYGILSLLNYQLDIAVFCFVVVGAILVFLWYNLPPARFYLSDTGSMGLTLALSCVAFLTREVILLPIIAFPLAATVASNIIQMLSKKYRGKKVFIAAPIHHHFQAKGLPAHTVVMRYWIVSIISVITGVVISVIS